MIPHEETLMQKDDFIDTSLNIIPPNLNSNAHSSQDEALASKEPIPLFHSNALPSQEEALVTEECPSTKNIPWVDDEL